ncbi:hypothetical protein DFH09DRAFT_1275425 [Mycena vulgaris]|nr:hypothetical protein DFH09DRAFT_1275425 [Mycena vulgaris]
MQRRSARLVQGPNAAPPSPKNSPRARSPWRRAPTACAATRRSSPAKPSGLVLPRARGHGLRAPGGGEYEFILWCCGIYLLSDCDDGPHERKPEMCVGPHTTEHLYDEDKRRTTYPCSDCDSDSEAEERE